MHHPTLPYHIPDNFRLDNTFECISYSQSLISDQLLIHVLISSTPVR